MDCIKIRVDQYNPKLLAAVSNYFEALLKYEPEKFNKDNYVTVVSNLNTESIRALLRRFMGLPDVFYNIELYYVVQLICEEHNENMYNVFEFFDFIGLKLNMYLRLIQGALDYVLGRIISEENFKPAGLFCVKFLTQLISDFPMYSTAQHKSLELLTSFVDKPTEELLNRCVSVHQNEFIFSKSKFKRELVGKFRSIYTTFQRTPHKCVFNCGLDLFISSYADFGKMKIGGCGRTPCCGAIAHHHCIRKSTGRCPICKSNYNRETGTVHGLLSMDGEIVAHDTLRIARRIYGIRMQDKVPMALDTVSQLKSSVNHMVRFTRFRSIKWNRTTLAWTYRYQWRNPVPNFTFEYFY